jgi:hypothetical protein
MRLWIVDSCEPRDLDRYRFRDTVLGRPYVAEVPSLIQEFVGTQNVGKIQF